MPAAIQAQIRDDLRFRTHQHPDLNIIFPESLPFLAKNMARLAIPPDLNSKLHFWL